MKKVKILALISAVVTGLLLFAFLNSLGKSEEPVKTGVVVASQEIPAETVITSDMVTLTQLPAEAVLTDALTDPSLVVGRVARETVYTGEQMLSSKLVTAGESGSDTLAYAVEPGMRAITIPVDQFSGLAYLVTPGNHVDILSYFLSDNGTVKTSYTTLVAEDLTVLAVDNVLSQNGKLGSDTSEYTALTLEVTPQQAMDLSMAQSEGQLRAILRSPVDDAKTSLHSTTLDKIMVK